MKLRPSKHLSPLFFASVLLSVSLQGNAVTGDTDQPITIDSDQQSLEMQGNKVTFSGNVVVKQGTIDIRADKVVVIRPTNENGKEIVEAFGNPVTFFQKQDNGKPVKGYGQTLRYELDKDFVTLTGNAYLEQLDSNVKGERITYLVKLQKLEAFGEKGKRVTTVLIPSQLQDKSNTAPPATKSK